MKLERRARDRGAPARVAERARIVLLAAEGPAHRGVGLAKWAKAAMLERIRHERPGAQRVRTDDVFSNAPMLAINDALGFKVISTRTEWQADVRDLLLVLL